MESEILHDIEKQFQDLIHNPTGGENTNTAEGNTVETAAEVPASAGFDRNSLQGPRYSTDGGIRLAEEAGGRPADADVETIDDRDSAALSEGSTLPPPYSSHFGDGASFL